MFGMSHESYLLLDAVVTIIGLIFLITKFKVHPFIALIIAAGFLGLTSGMPVDKIIKAFQDGFGGVLGFVGIILALGTMLGKMMAESGGADQIAQTLIRAFGKEKVQWAMMFAAFLVGIPLFFEIGFVLLIPLVFIVARRTGVSLIKIGIPLLAGLSAVHGLVPPHPGPLLAIGVFGADIGKTILYGLIVALPTAIIAGPIFGTFIAKYIPGNPSQELIDQLARESEHKTLPSFSITLITVLLPVFLMLLKNLRRHRLGRRSCGAQLDGHDRSPDQCLAAGVAAVAVHLRSSPGHPLQADPQAARRQPGADRRDHPDHRCRWWFQTDAGDQRRGRRDRPYGGERADQPDPAGVAGGGGDSGGDRFGDSRDHHWRRHRGCRWSA